MTKYKLYLWINDTYSQITLNSTVHQEVTLSTKYDEPYYVPELDQDYVVVLKDNGEIRLADVSLNVDQVTKINDRLNVLLVSNKVTTYSFDLSRIYRNQILSIGRNELDDIQLMCDNDVLLKLGENPGTFVISASRISNLYLNHRKVRENKVTFGLGDVICLGRIELIVQDNNLLVIRDLLNRFVKSSLFHYTGKRGTYPEEYPEYHRSPRALMALPKEKIIIDNPPSKEQPAKNKLARTIATPLVMVAASILMSVINRNMTTMILMGAMSVTTISFSISSYFSDKKEQKQRAIDRVINYHDYLQNKIVEIQKQKRGTREALEYHYPTGQEISNLIANNSPRVYEKNKFQTDFLAFRIGTGDFIPKYQVTFSSQEMEKDVLLDEANDIYKDSMKVDDAPISINLTNGGIGLVGNFEQVNIAVQNMLLQIATFQSYHDVRFIAVFNENQRDEWIPFKWLKHFRTDGSNTLNFVYDEKTRDQLMTSLFQMLKDREQIIKDNGPDKEKVVFSPQYILIIQDEELIISHSIMEYMGKDISNLGVSVVFIKNTTADLPEYIKNVIEYKDSKQGEILIEEGLLSNKKFVPGNLEGVDLESVVRKLSSLEHKESLKNSIPTSVSLLDLYNTNKVDDLQLKMRWTSNLPYKSLAVPLGERGKDDIVKLDLHERAHGPHGLIAGTTGSGKSELIQSYIASLAINFHPDNVGFLLIDYKGGGMANLFNDLPHLLGTITNLDGSQSLRALASIKAELEKRQTLFGQYNVNHINEYQKLYHEGSASEAMPHLFLISDEFAELKSEQPEFMEELVSTARIGRSLGIHLILATQKPSGVVNEQIWSNSRFKIALKVQDQADSNEILHTPDAASIVEPGRAYLQVGNNEIYELFQSAYSGKTYNPDETEDEEYDPLYIIDSLGQYKNFSEDLSGLSKQLTQSKEKKINELTAITNYISDFAEQNQINRLPRPWLPPLGEKIIFQDYGSIDYPKNWKEESLSLSTLVGMVDYPDQQAQKPFEIDLNEHKHIAVFASPGYGKSTFIQTFIMGICRDNSPDDFNIYLLDFGTNGLLPLRELPHTADLIRIDEIEKIVKFEAIIAGEINHRKQLLSKAGVANLDQYVKSTGNRLPIIEVVVDTVDSAKEAPWFEEFNSILDKITREGSNVGVYLMISANRHGALRMQLLSNIKTQISLYLFDKSEVNDIVGRSEVTIDDLPGRGLIKLDTIRLFQTFLPTEGTDSLEILENVKKEAGEMKTDWKGKVPARIPMIPEELTWDLFSEMSKCSDHEFALGLNSDTTLPITYEFSRDKYFLILNETDEQKQNFDTMISNELEQKNQNESMIIDGEANKDDILKKLNQLKDRCDSDEEDEDRLVYINDLESILKVASDEDFDFQDILEQGQSVGLHILINTYLSFISGNYDDVPSYIRSNLKVGIIGSRITDQDLVTFQYISNEPYLKEDEAYYFKNRSYSKIRIPK
ncbi:type VII secretion protein EssC [Xylocopilactobacillus apicola]|uniref:Type VII secretion protein EssC n=1 Tax=Xylocopilactobacillus apicola TaxID=2932184 RepID=A0AAU9CZM8_9LACO|nr:type VII secretion protein EssC [Xylocopilactobacillus apicola]BDR59444.1 type VII secretion protein EssC [Xylocopilactobacillus apicola]